MELSVAMIFNPLQLFLSKNQMNDSFKGSSNIFSQLMTIHRDYAKKNNPNPQEDHIPKMKSNLYL